MNSLYRFLSGALLILPMAVLSNYACAETTYSKIIYNEATKSYFQYIEHDLRHSIQWPAADRLARGRTYKGVHGRLALVPNQEVNNFLRDHFPIDTWVWIGLRHFCKFGKSVWVNGQGLDLESYQNWDQRWYRTDINCKKRPPPVFMPVYYTPQKNGFRWQASGPGKAMYGYFVEYPTGGP